MRRREESNGALRVERRGRRHPHVATLATEVRGHNPRTRVSQGRENFVSNAPCARHRRVASPRCRPRSSPVAPGFSARTSARRSSRRDSALSASTTSRSRRSRTSSTSAATASFVNHDVTEQIAIDEPVDVVYHLAALASPIDYLRLPLHSLKTGSYGTHHALGLAKWKRARFLLASTSEVYGDPEGPSAAGDVLGERQPDRPSRRLRRGEALCRGPDDGLPPTAGRRHGHRSDFQHLRPADAAERRAGDPDVHAAGARGEATHCLRRRLPDAELLLRRRPDPRPDPARRVRRAHAGEHRQPGSTPSSSSRRRCSPPRVRRARSCSRPCRSTTRRCGSPISRVRSSSSAGSRRSRSTTAFAVRSRRSAGTPRVRRFGRALAAAAFGLALLAAPTASASSSLRVGIFDDGVVLYGEPDRVFPQLARTEAKLLRVNLWWAGPSIRVATSRPRRPADPKDPAYNWDTYDRTVRFAIVNGIEPVFSIVGTPPWANSARGWNVAPNNARDLRLFAAAAQRRYNGSFKNAEGVTLPRQPLDGVERAEQPGLPEAAVSPHRWKMGDPVGARLREDLQRGRPGHKVRPAVLHGRVWGDRPPRQQQSQLGSSVRRPGSVLASDEGRRRQGLRRVRAPSVLRVACRDAHHEATPGGGGSHPRR